MCLDVKAAFLQFLEVAVVDGFLHPFWYMYFDPVFFSFFIFTAQELHSEL